jgi:predicted dehydrogenase
MTLKVAILGAGMMGQAHARAYEAVGAQILAVADIRRQAAEDLTSQCGGCAFDSAGELLSADLPLDAVSICLPHSLHHENALACAANGLHLLVEKPLDLTAARARVVVDACRRADVRLMVGFTQRFMAVNRELKAAIDSGAFGVIGMCVDYLAAGGAWPALSPWCFQQATAGGGIQTIGSVHAADRFRWLLDDEVETVYSVSRQVGQMGDVEDVGIATLQFASGTQAVLVAYRSSLPNHERRHTYEVYGTLAEAAVDLNPIERQPTRIVTIEGAKSIAPASDDPFVAQAREFVAAIEERRDPSPGGEDGLMATAIIEACYKSASTGQPVQVANLL